MYVVTVLFSLKADRAGEFLSLMRENAKLSVANEPGCHQFDVCLDDSGLKVFLYETYSDRAAFDDHLGSQHFKDFDLATLDMYVSKDVATYALL